MNRALAFWIALLLVFSGSMLFWMAARRGGERVSSEVGAESTGNPETVAGQLPRLEEFELLDQTGARFNSKSLAGQVWLGSFFFVSCPATCYQQNMKLQQLYAKYAEQGLKVVSITCDPDNDTPVALAGYAARFNADAQTWKFLTTLDGDRTYLQQIGNDYMGIMVDAHQVTHSDRVVLFDRDKTIRGSYQVLKPKDFQQLETALSEIFSESPPATDDPPAPEATAAAPAT